MGLGVTARVRVRVRVRGAQAHNAELILGRRVRVRRWPLVRVWVRVGVGFGTKR